jgi:hypothetical protein
MNRLLGTLCCVTANYIDTQWTAEARNAYARRAEELITEIRRHVEATLQRQGRQAEHQSYFESAERLRSAAEAFNDAELDWCGSFPLALRGADEDDTWDEGDGAEDDEPTAVLSVLSRWDFRVTDVDAVIAAGRAAYLTAWPDDTEEDARVRVQDVVSAAAEITHAHGLSSLHGSAGLEPDHDFTEFVVHDGEDDDAFQADPFAIVHRDSDV